MHAGATVDHQDLARTWFAEGLLDQQIVLEAADGRDAAGKCRAAAEWDELCVTTADIGADLVGEVCGGDSILRFGHHTYFAAFAPCVLRRGSR
ncbi:hypothetical protein GCM10023318_12780 [Nocardia callitridis]|uniref:Uncharacterized protein n=1 Tax=Nocardia callitridis TaxID=648753 RepID=A0ABP9K045_9NOCA